MGSVSGRRPRGRRIPSSSDWTSRLPSTHNHPGSSPHPGHSPVSTPCCALQWLPHASRCTQQAGTVGRLPGCQSSCRTSVLVPVLGTSPNLPMDRVHQLGQAGPAWEAQVPGVPDEEPPPSHTMGPGPRASVFKTPPHPHGAHTSPANTFRLTSTLTDTVQTRIHTHKHSHKHIPHIQIPRTHTQPKRLSIHTSTHISTYKHTVTNTDPHSYPH